MQQYGVGRSPVQWNLSIVVNNGTSIFGQYIQTGGYCKQVILYRISVRDSNKRWLPSRVTTIDGFHCIQEMWSVICLP